MMKRPSKTSLYSVVLFSGVIDGNFHIAHPNWQQIQQCHHLATAQHYILKTLTKFLKCFEPKVALFSKDLFKQNCINGNVNIHPKAYHE